MGCYRFAWGFTHTIKQLTMSVKAGVCFNDIRNPPKCSFSVPSWVISLCLFIHDDDDVDDYYIYYRCGFLYGRFVHCQLWPVNAVSKVTCCYLQLLSVLPYLFRCLYLKVCLKFIMPIVVALTKLCCYVLVPLCAIHRCPYPGVNPSIYYLWQFVQSLAWRVDCLKMHSPLYWDARNIAYQIT